MSDDPPIEDKVTVLHPHRVPATTQAPKNDPKQEMRRRLTEWKRMVDAGDLASLILIGGLKADGQTVTTYAAQENPLTMIGRLRQAEHSLLQNKD